MSALIEELITIPAVRKGMGLSDDVMRFFLKDDVANLLGHDDDFIRSYIVAGYELEIAGVKEYFLEPGLDVPIADRFVIDTIREEIGIHLKTLKQKNAFRILCLNFMWHGLAALCISLDRNEYSNSPYNTSKVSYEAIRQVLDKLEKADLLIIKPGSYKLGRRTVISAKGSFYKSLKENKPSIKTINNNAPLIILRQGKSAQDEGGQRLKYKITPELKVMEKELKEINSFLKAADIQFSKDNIPQEIFDDFTEGQKETVINMTLSNRRHHRIFTNDFTQHGRIYGAFWQQLPSEARSYIRINGNPVVRVDFKAQHAHMLYVRATGQPYYNPRAKKEPFDPHNHVCDANGKPFDRKLVKMAFNTMINCKNRQEAIGAIARHKKLEELGLKERFDERDAFILTSAILTHHQPISDFIFDSKRTTPIALDLMYDDSEITFNILKKAYRDGKVVLSIHDEFIMEATDKDYLLNTAITQYLHYFDNKVEFKSRIDNIIHILKVL